MNIIKKLNKVYDEIFEEPRYSWDNEISKIEEINQDIKAIYKGFNMLYEYLEIEECHQEEKYYLRKIEKCKK